MKILAVPVKVDKNSIEFFIDPYRDHAPKRFYEPKLTCCGTTLTEMFPDAGENGVPALPLNQLLSELEELGVSIVQVIETRREGSGFCG